MCTAPPEGGNAAVRKAFLRWSEKFQKDAAQCAQISGSGHPDDVEVSLDVVTIKKGQRPKGRDPALA
jgi:hypothetical protein